MPSRTYSTTQQSLLMVGLGILFILAIPCLLAAILPALERLLNVPPLPFPQFSRIAGIILMAAGFPLGFWAVAVQAVIGKGTPAPMIPAQSLIVQPPYTYCRNPMALGTILGYIGIGLVVGSLLAVAAVIIMGGALLMYIHIVEEQQLVERFGADYEEYRRRTPFIIPRLRKGGN